MAIHISLLGFGYGPLDHLGLPGEFGSHTKTCCICTEQPKAVRALQESKGLECNMRVGRERRRVLPFSVVYALADHGFVT